MTISKTRTNDSPSRLESQLDVLKWPFIRQNFSSLAQQATQQGWSHLDFLSNLVEGEYLFRQDRATQRRIQNASFPVIKTLDHFQWSWPLKINQPQIKNLFHLTFIKEHGNIIFLGNVGLGKTHISISIGHHACLQGYNVLFITAIDAINQLAAAQISGRLKTELAKYLKPDLLILDELGYLPIDKNGADLLFQIISHRYERGSIIITSNRVFKKWPEIFNNDATLTSAILDRLLHHAETVVIEGRSFRMKDQIE